MELLVCVISDPNMTDEVLQGFVEIGVSGATVIDSYGMAKVLLQDIPIFAGFRSLLAGSGSYSKTIFSVIKDPALVDQAIAAIHRICGDLENPNTGIVFTVPVNRVGGLRPESE